MTRSERDRRKAAELNAAFLLLSDSGKDRALGILRALSFAQSVMTAETGGGRPGPVLDNWRDME